MFISLLSAWGLSPDHCLMVGDQSIDMDAARAARMRGVIFPGGNLREFLEPLLVGRTA
jgi:D-glycero-D-manno-heptose 1,7-bisphosphate phosphatase